MKYILERTLAIIRVTKPGLSGPIDFFSSFSHKSYYSRETEKTFALPSSPPVSTTSPPSAAGRQNTARSSTMS